LPKAIYDEIIAHAREGKPEEICGVLRGRANEARELFRGINVAEDKINNYDLDAPTLLMQFEFEDQGDEMMGIYHSHPISEAYPSATDAWNAHYPDSVYLICSLEHDDAPVIRAFRLLTQFPQLDIDALRAAIPFEEVRPGLFGYYQAKEQTLPAVLKPLTDLVTPPFYIVFSLSDQGQPVEDVRVVEVREQPVQVV
jgi:proteasome lid subunit RPN8/RPN11